MIDYCFDFIGAGANGTTVQQWKRLLPYLRSRLGDDCNVSFSNSCFFLAFLFDVKVSNFGRK